MNYAVVKYIVAAFAQPIFFLTLINVVRKFFQTFLAGVGLLWGSLRSAPGIRRRKYERERAENYGEGEADKSFSHGWGFLSFEIGEGLVKLERL
jgi:hypothetical protein